ncbi:MAG: SAM hydroxide adenosyltransferase, partial [Ilumatobacteraceae bacterium]
IVPLARTEGDHVVAEVTWVHRYGNCQLNVGPEDGTSLGPRVSIELTSVTGERSTRAANVVRNFSEIGGGIGLVIDSFGMLAICIDRGSAAVELSIAVGDAVRLAALMDSPGITTNVSLRRAKDASSGAH